MVAGVVLGRAPVLAGDGRRGRREVNADVGLLLLIVLRWSKRDHHMLRLVAGADSRSGYTEVLSIHRGGLPLSECTAACIDT